MTVHADPVMTPRRSYAGVDHAVRQQQKRARFIEVGTRLFGSYGYYGTTIRMLVAESGLNNRNFYECFQTMEDLLVACYEHLTSRFAMRLKSALQGAPDQLETQLKAMALCYFEQIKDPHYARITQVEVLGVSPRVDAVYVGAMREFSMLGIAQLKRFNSESNHSTRELEIISFALTGALVMAGSMWVRSHYRDPIEVIVEATFKILLGTAKQLSTLNL